MKNIPINKLWVCLPTKENLLSISNYPMSRATEDHCLVISPERPEGCFNVGERRIKLLDAEDWKWIREQSAKIRAEQEIIYQKQIEEEQDRFLDRLEKELEAIRKERRADGRTERNPEAK